MPRYDPENVQKFKKVGASIILVLFCAVPAIVIFGPVFIRIAHLILP